MLAGFIPLWTGLGVTLDEAAASVGNPVDFTGEVKAISVSPDSHAMYLNIGGSYSRPALSAMIPSEKKDIIDGIPDDINGRSVRVTGTVESSPRGPIVTISDAKQLEVLPLEAGDVLNEEGEGTLYTERFGIAVRKLLDDRDYDTLERLADRWQAEKSLTLDGLWKSALLFDSLNLSSSASEEFFQKRLAALEAWAKTKPDSVFPIIASARVLTAYAWSARGSGYANTVSDDQWKEFGKRLNQAREKLESAGDKGKKCPAWFAAMQTIALGEQWPKEDYEKLFAEAVALEPEYLPFYFQKAYWLLPRWYGDPGEWEKFALDARKGVKNGDVLYARICWSQAWAFRNIFFESSIQWPLVKKGFEEMLTLFPKSSRNLNYFGLMAGKANDRATCKEVLSEIGPHPDIDTWRTAEQFDQARKWAEDPAANPPGIFRLGGAPKPSE